MLLETCYDNKIRIFYFRNYITSMIRPIYTT